MKRVDRPELGWFLGLLVALPVGGGSAISAGASAEAVTLSILGAASLLMPLSWATRLIQPSLATLGWLLATLGNSLWLLSLLGAMLHAKTHHRPLGGATFAVLSVLVLVGCSVVAARALSLSRSANVLHRRLGRALGVGLLLSASIGCSLLLAHENSGDPGALRISLEGLAMLACVGVAASVPVPLSGARWLSWAGPALWLLLGACGAYATVQYAEALPLVSPVLSGLLPLFR